MRFTVAIDGPAAAGKGTIGRAVAERFGFAHLDTGLLYRAVGARVLAGERPVAAARALAPDDLADPDALRTPDVAQAASKVAVIPEVREHLLDFQRAFAHRQGGAVLDGRDIGTVICPHAEVKLFVTASAEVRARRRMDELVGRGLSANFDAVLADVKARDARDADRATAPMVAAEDALVLDTSDMDIAEAVAAAVAAVRARQQGEASGPGAMPRS
jgi:cytidylate kinase